MTRTVTLEIVADLIDELHAESKHVNSEADDMLATAAALSAEATEAEQALKGIALVKCDEMQTSQPERVCT